MIRTNYRKRLHEAAQRCAGQIDDLFTQIHKVEKACEAAAAQGRFDTYVKVPDHLSDDIKIEFGELFDGFVGDLMRLSWKTEHK